MPSNAISTEQPMMNGNDLKMNELASAKDKAQLAAITAISMAHVGMLRELLRQGPGQDKFRTPVIILLSVSLALQVAAGAMVLFLTNARRHYSKYGRENFWGDVFCCRRPHRSACCGCCGNPAGSDEADLPNDEDLAYEDKILEMLNESADEILRKEKEYAVAKTKVTEAETDSRGFNLTDEELKDLKKVVVEYDALQEYNQLLRRRAAHAQHRRVLNKLAPLQNWLNYILYAILTLNIFITGLIFVTAG